MSSYVLLGPPCAPAYVPSYAPYYIPSWAPLFALSCYPSYAYVMPLPCASVLLLQKETTRHVDSGLYLNAHLIISTMHIVSSIKK